MMEIDDSRRWDQLRAQLGVLPEEFRGSVRRYARTAFLPKISAKPAARALTYLGGVPLLGPGDEHPKCGVCGSQLQLLFQADSDSWPVPSGQSPAGTLLQVFYCVSRNYCGLRVRDTKRTGPAALVRRIGAVGAAMRPGESTERLPRRTVRGWIAIEELPDCDEWWRLGISDKATSLMRDHCIEHAEYGPAFDDKVLGWRSWIQFCDRARCARCDAPMIDLVQIVGEGVLPFRFAGGISCGVVAQCPDHPEEMAFTYDWVN